MTITKKTKATTAKKSQAEIDALTEKRGYDFKLELRRMHKLAKEQMAYLEKHPGPDVVIWKPLIYGGVRDERDWSTVQDRTGKTIIGRTAALKIGENFELCTNIIKHGGGKEIAMYAHVLRQVSMAEAEAVAGHKLPCHKPFCYEVICD